MAKLSKDIVAGNLHPRENLTATGPLASNGAELVLAVDGCNAFTLDMRGTFNLTFELSGSVDGTNYRVIPFKPVDGSSYINTLAGTAQGIWRGSCAGYKQIRVRVTAYTSGPATATLLASISMMDDVVRENLITPLVATVTAAIGLTAVLTIPNPGVGLRNYVTYLAINRFAGALLVAAATPVLVTTTNLPGTLVFSVPAEAALQGTMDRYREDFAFPLASTAQNATTVITCPATTNVIWRVTAGYFVAP
jgi:hypothetical protein